jgi:hypothetical protein
MLAARNTSIPAPEPRSTTVSPSFMKANFVGVPHPAQRIEASGIDFSSFESYPTNLDTCSADCEGRRTALLYSEQHPPPDSKFTEGPQHESPVSDNFPYLSFTFSLANQS